MLPIENSLVGPVAETHDLLYERRLSIVAETSHSDPAPPRRARAARARARSASSARTPSRSSSAASCSRADGRHARSRRPRRPTPPRRSRSRHDPAKPRSPASAPPRSTALQVIDHDVGDHPEAFTRFVSVATHTRIDRERDELEDGLLVRHRPPVRRAPRRDRAVRAPRASTSCSSCRGRSRSRRASYRFDAVLAGHPLEPATRGAFAEVRARVRRAARASARTRAGDLDR